MGCAGLGRRRKACPTLCRAVIASALWLGCLVLDTRAIHIGGRYGRLGSYGYAPQPVPGPLGTTNCKGYPYVHWGGYGYGSYGKYGHSYGSAGVPQYGCTPGPAPGPLNPYMPGGESSILVVLFDLFFADLDVSAWYLIQNAFIDDCAIAAGVDPFDIYIRYVRSGSTSVGPEVVFTSTQTDAAQNFVTVLQDASTYSVTFPSLASTGSIEVSGITLTAEAAGTEITGTDGVVQAPYVSWTLTLPNLDPSDWAKKGYDKQNPATTLQDEYVNYIASANSFPNTSWIYITSVKAGSTIVDTEVIWKDSDATSANAWAFDLQNDSNNQLFPMLGPNTAATSRRRLLQVTGGGYTISNIQTGTTDITTTPKTSGYSKGGLSGGQIAGIVVGSVVGAALIVAVIIFFCFRRRGRGGSTASGSNPNWTPIQSQPPTGAVSQPVRSVA